MCIVAFVTPDSTTEERSATISTLLRRLMSLRTRGVTSEGEVIIEESELRGLADVAASFGADQILMVSGTGRAAKGRPAHR